MYQILLVLAMTLSYPEWFIYCILSCWSAINQLSKFWCCISMLGILCLWDLCFVCKSNFCRVYRMTFIGSSKREEQYWCCNLVLNRGRIDSLLAGPVCATFKICQKTQARGYAVKQELFLCMWITTRLWSCILKRHAYLPYSVLVIYADSNLCGFCQTTLLLLFLLWRSSLHLHHPVSHTFASSVVKPSHQECYASDTVVRSTTCRRGCLFAKCAAESFDLIAIYASMLYVMIPLESDLTLVTYVAVDFMISLTSQHINDATLENAHFHVTFAVKPLDRWELWRPIKGRTPKKLRTSAALVADSSMKDDLSGVTLLSNIMTSAIIRALPVERPSSGWNICRITRKGFILKPHSRISAHIVIWVLELRKIWIATSGQFIWKWDLFVAPSVIRHLLMDRTCGFTCEYTLAASLLLVAFVAYSLHILAVWRHMRWLIAWESCEMFAFQIVKKICKFSFLNKFHCNSWSWAWP